MNILGRTSVRPLTGSEIARARSVLQARFPAADVTAAQADEDGGGAIIQFTNPAAAYGQHGTIHVRWERGDMATGHYFDAEFQADCDFIYRSRRGY